MNDEAQESPADASPPVYRDDTHEAVAEILSAAERIRELIRGLPPEIRSRSKFQCTIGFTS